MQHKHNNNYYDWAWHLYMYVIAGPVKNYLYHGIYSIFCSNLIYQAIYLSIYNN